MYFWNKLFHPRIVFKCRDPFFAVFFFSYNVIIVFEQCLLCWMPVKLFLSNWTMKKCFCNCLLQVFLQWFMPSDPDQCIKGRRGFRIPGAGFQYLSLELGFWIPIVSEIPDSLSCIPNSKVQDSGFHEQNLFGFLFQQRGDFETIADPILPFITITLRCKPNQSNFSDATTCDALRCRGRSAFIQPFRMPVKRR